MIAMSSKSLCAIRDACREIGETSVTIASDAGVITFDFSWPDEVRAKPLAYETQPTRQQLSAILGVPLSAETA